MWKLIFGKDKIAVYAWRKKKKNPKTQMYLTKHKN